MEVSQLKMGVKYEMKLRYLVDELVEIKNDVRELHLALQQVELVQVQ